LLLTFPTVKRQTGTALAAGLNQPDLIKLIRTFLQDQLRADSISNLSSGSDNDLPEFHNSTPISTYLSTVATFYAPSDLSGISGMHCEQIRATPSWQNEGPRHDCILININPTQDGMRGLDVARVRLFFSIKFQNIMYPCALVHWYSHGSPFVAVIHLDSVLCAAHLIGVYGADFLPKGIPLTSSLDVFQSHYVNKYIDHHAFEIAF
jgi:hypothetical protein